MHLLQPNKMLTGIALARFIAVGYVMICLFVVTFAAHVQPTKLFIAGSVRFTNTGHAAKHATIELHRQGSRRTIKVTKTDSTGNYRFDNIAPGLYRLKLRYSSGVCAETIDVDIRQSSQPEANILTEGCL